MRVGALLIGRDGQDPGPGLRAAVAVAIVEHVEPTRAHHVQRAFRIERDALRLKEVVGEDGDAHGPAVRTLSLEHLDEIAFRAVVVGRWIVRVRFDDEQASACIDRCPYRGDDIGVLGVQSNLQTLVAEPRISRVALTGKGQHYEHQQDSAQVQR